MRVRSCISPTIFHYALNSIKQITSVCQNYFPTLQSFLCNCDIVSQICQIDFRIFFPCFQRNDTFSVETTWPFVVFPSYLGILIRTTEKAGFNSYFSGFRCSSPVTFAGSFCRHCDSGESDVDLNWISEFLFGDHWFHILDLCLLNDLFNTMMEDIIVIKTSRKKTNTTQVTVNVDCVIKMCI